MQPCFMFIIKHLPPHVTAYVVLVHVENYGTFDYWIWPINFLFDTSILNALLKNCTIYTLDDLGCISFCLIGNGKLFGHAITSPSGTICRCNWRDPPSGDAIWTPFEQHDHLNLYFFAPYIPPATESSGRQKLCESYFISLMFKHLFE